MAKIVNFKIKNSTDSDIVIVHEPEAIDFYLPKQETVVIQCNACEDNIGLFINHNDGVIAIQIWDSVESSFKVFYKGKDVFEEFL